MKTKSRSMEIVKSTGPLIAICDEKNCNRVALLTKDAIAVAVVNCIVGEEIANAIIHLWNAEHDKPL